MTIPIAEGTKLLQRDTKLDCREQQPGRCISEPLLWFGDLASPTRTSAEASSQVSVSLNRRLSSLSSIH